MLNRISYGDGRAGVGAIITQQSIAGALTNEINRLISNLQLGGYTILGYQISRGTPESLRTFLRYILKGHSLSAINLLLGLKSQMIIINMVIPNFQ
jgi:hypothetical protein|uniref:Uncharacterized protein n=1 Tax=candidate division WOR-3 bacterium TaxID=2052148 RepID=A0A7V3RJ57_UNCW3